MQQLQIGDSTVKADVSEILRKREVIGRTQIVIDTAPLDVDRLQDGRAGWSGRRECRFYRALRRRDLSIAAEATHCRLPNLVETMPMHGSRGAACRRSAAPHLHGRGVAHRTGSTVTDSKPLSVPRLLPRLLPLARAGALVLGGALAALPALAAAQEMPRIDVARGAFLIHGNFCGPGNRGPGYPPVDALDAACARHDACTPNRASGRLPHCACNDRLHEEADAVARDPSTPPRVRETARFIADGADVLPCDD